MPDIEKRPGLRFKDFDDAWEQRKLGETTDVIVAGGDIEKTLLKTQGKYPVIANALEREGIIGYYEEKYRIGAPAMTVTGRGNVGNAKARFVNFTPIVRLLAIRSIHDPVFLENAINRLHIIVESTGVPQLTVPQLSNNELMFPTSLEEEKKIGELFLKLDGTITLHQRKLDGLKKLKKSLLQKMFPKIGETKPELRFPGFTDAWEQRKLGDAINIGSGRDYKHLGEGNIPVYGTGGYLTSVDQALSSEKDAVGIGRKGTINSPYILKAPFWTVDTLFFCLPKPAVDLNFLFCLFQRVDWKKKDESTGVPSLSKRTIENTEIPFCSIEEQRKIGTFFDSLEKTITLHQQKLSVLQNIKKSLLRRMFP